jgi:hypothetical protein
MSGNIIAILKVYAIGLIVIIGLICGTAFFFMVTLNTFRIVCTVIGAAVILLGWVIVRSRNPGDAQ